MERDRYVSSSTAAAAAGNTERKHRSRSDKRVVSHSHGSFMRTNSNCSNISTLSTSVTTTNTTHINYNEDSHKSNTTGGHASSHKHPHHFEQREKEDEDHKIEMKELTESEIQKTHLHASLTGQNKANELKGKLDEIKLMEQIHKMEEEYAHLYGLYTSQQEQLQGMSTLREEAKLLKLQKANTDECSGSNGELGKYKELLCRINDELCAVHDLSVGADESKLQARLHVNANMGERVSAKKLHKGINSKSNINAVSDELQTHILHISQRLRLLILSERNKRQTIQSMNSELEDLKQKYTEVSKCNNSSSSGSITDKCNSNNTNNMVNSTLSIQEKQHLLSKIEHCMSERDEAINAQTQTQQKLETVQYQLERSSRRNGTLQREVEKMKRQLSESERKWNKLIQSHPTGGDDKKNCSLETDNITSSSSSSSSHNNSRELSRVFVGKEFVILWRISPNEFVACLEEYINYVMTTWRPAQDKQFQQISKCSIAQINAHTHDVEVIFIMQICNDNFSNNNINKETNANNAMSSTAGTLKSKSNEEMMQELEYLLLHEWFPDLHNLALSYLTQYDDEQQEEMHEQLRNDDEAIRILHEQLEDYKNKARNLAQELECQKVKQHDMEELVAKTFDETEVALVDMQHALNTKEYELEKLHSQHKLEIENLKMTHLKMLAEEIKRMKKSVSSEMVQCNEKEANMRSTLLRRFQLHIPVHFTYVTNKCKTEQTPSLQREEKQKPMPSCQSEKQEELQPEQKSQYNNMVELLQTLFATTDNNNNATSSTKRYFDNIQDLNVMKETICSLLLKYIATITQTVPRRLVSCKVIELNNTTPHTIERNRNKQESHSNVSHELLVEVDLMLYCTRNNENAIIANVQKILDNLNLSNNSYHCDVIFEIIKLYTRTREQVSKMNVKLERQLEEYKRSVSSNASLQIKKYEKEEQWMHRVMSLFLQQWQKEPISSQDNTSLMPRVKELLMECLKENPNITQTLSFVLELVNQDRVATRTQCQTLQNTINNLNQNNAHMELQINKLTEQIKKSDAALNNQKNSGNNALLTLIRAKLDVEKAKSKQLHEQLTKANAEKCTLQGQLKELEVDLTDFANIQSSLQEEISLLQRRLHAAEQDKEILQCELNRIKKSVQTKTNNISTVSNTNNNKKTSNNNDNCKNVVLDAASATMNNINYADYYNKNSKQQKSITNKENQNTSKESLTENEEEEENGAASVTTNASFRSTNVEKTVTVYKSPIKAPPSSLSTNTNSKNNSNNNLSNYSRPLPANQGNLYSSHGSSSSSSSQIMSHLYKRTHSSDSALSVNNNNLTNNYSLGNNSIIANSTKYANNTSKHTSPIPFTKSNSYTSGLSNKLSTTRPSRESSNTSIITDNVNGKPSVCELSPFSVCNSMYNYSNTNTETNNNTGSSNKRNQTNKNDININKVEEKEILSKEVVGGANSPKRNYTSMFANNSVNKNINNNNSSDSTKNVSKAPALRHRFSRS